jgi:hypothetical protein
MRLGVGVGQGHRSPTAFSTLASQIPAEFCTSLWSRKLFVADLDSLGSLQACKVEQKVYFAHVSLGCRSRNSRRLGNVGMDWAALNNVHLLSTYVGAFSRSRRHPQPDNESKGSRLRWENRANHFSLGLTWWK